ncbi:MAG: carbohydrate ABC transporter substrate-binding protein [Clostridia bacterium]|nr:carbohydrate ABC transporter substrate-binding protein [Clostridia bacterium]
MKKINKKSLVKAALLMLAVVLVAGVFGCKKTVIQYGDVDQTLTKDDLLIKGTIKFTENNASNTEADSLAPKAIVAAFERAYPGTKVVYEEAASSSYATRISSGDIGDVFWGDASDLHNYHTNHNALMPLDSYIKPLDIDLGEVYTGAIDIGKIDGRLYMAPRNIGEHILVYNKDILSEAGLDMDNTQALPWDTFKSMCKQMTKFGDDGVLTQVGASLKVWWHPIFQVFFRGYGGKWIDSVEHRVTIADSTEVMQGVNELFDGLREAWIYPEDIAGSIKGELGEKYKGISNTYSQACFKNFGDLSWTVSYGTAYDALSIDWDFCPFPALPTHTVSTGATGYLVYNRTTNPDTAAAFALFFLTEDGQRAYHGQTGGNVPLVKSLAHEDFWHEQGTVWSGKNYDAFVSYADQTQPTNVVTMAPQEVADLFSTSAMQNLFISVLNGNMDVFTAFSQLQTKANEKWSTIMD